MIDEDFRWYLHLWKQQFPALTQAVLNDRIVPKFDLTEAESHKAWHIPLGDLRRLDTALSEMDGVEYASKFAHAYM